jgi:hypothetical protein
MPKIEALPVVTDFLIEEKKGITEGEPASLSNAIKKAALKELATVNIDEKTLEQTVSAISSLVGSIKKISNESESSVKADTVNIQLGITKSGKIGVMGSGMDLRVVTVIQVGFKVI